jgi:hypothetical protein
LSRFTDKLFSAIIIFETSVDMVLIMVDGGCSVFDGSEPPPGFDEELDLCLGAFGYVGIYV